MFVYAQAVLLEIEKESDDNDPTELQAVNGNGTGGQAQSCNPFSKSGYITHDSTIWQGVFTRSYFSNT